MSSFKLFIQGVFGILLQFIGIPLCIIGFFGIVFEYNKIIPIILFIIGVIMVFYGKYLRFDYKLNSGSIIHRGDW
jgi:hypothetical protein